MVNHLKLKSPFSYWKYVDDLTISEAIPVKGDSKTQAALDQVNHWASYNDMKLNPKKCKELVISFARSDVCTPDLTIDRVDLERVQSHKVLGLTLQNNLKWNTHVDVMIVKSSRRLHILRVMKQANVPATHLLSLYSTLIRSTLECHFAVLFGEHHYQHICQRNSKHYRNVLSE